MKKAIILVLIIAILIMPFTYRAFANTELIKYFFISRCEEIQFKLTYKEGATEGFFVLFDPFENQYRRSSQTCKQIENGYLYTIKKPIAGKWALVVDDNNWDDINFEIIEKGIIGEKYDERFGVPPQTTSTEYRMRYIYSNLDNFDDSYITTINETFVDMSKEHWASKYVAQMHYLGIMGGYGDKTFRPENMIKTDEFVKIAIKAMGYEIESAPYGYWAQPFIDKALQLKLIEEDEYTDYTLPITREQAAKLMVFATGLKEDLPDRNLIKKIHEDIADYSQISDYYKDTVATSYAVGLITGVDGYFQPKDNLTRAQASTIVMRYIDMDLRKPYVPVSLRNVEYVTLANNQGRMVNVYPSDYEEVIEAAKVLKEAVKLTKGASFVKFGSENEAISAWFYKDTESKLKGTTSFKNEDIELLNMSINIYMNDIIKENYGVLCYISMSEIDEVRDYHLEVIHKMFEYLFAAESENAFKKFTDGIDSYFKGDTKILNFRFNDRHMNLKINESGMAILLYPIGYRGEFE